MLLAYNDLITDKEANDTAAEYVRQRIRGIVTDPETAENLCPTDHPLGTKRPCLDTNYYATYNLPHVRLVNLKKTPLVEITEQGVRTSDEDFEFDSIVFATGFDAMTGSLTAFDIAGRDGALLKERWAEGPRTYLGIQVVGFPNFFTLTGPQSPSVLTNMPVAIEQHVEWVSELIDFMGRTGKTVIEPTPEAQDQWVAHVNEIVNMTLMTSANSWYMSANIPGKPRAFLPYLGPEGVGGYRKKCDEVAAKGYEGFALE